MKYTFTLLLLRDLQRWLRSRLMYVMASLFYLVQALYFLLVLNSQSGPQPQIVSPIHLMYKGGYLLILYCIFIPALVAKITAEERSQGTWNAMLTTGVGSLNILFAKCCHALLQFSFWFFLSSVFPLVIIYYGTIDWMVACTAYFGAYLVGIHWLMFCLFIAGMSSSIMLSFLKGSISLICYWSFPLLKILFPDPFWRPFFNSIDFNLILSRMSKGFIYGSDICFLFVGTLFLFGLCLIKFSQEDDLYRRLWARKVQKCLVVLLMGMILYSSQWIAYQQPWKWDVATLSSIQLSSAFRKQLKKLPDGIRVTVILPQFLEVESYYDAKKTIVSFLERISLYHRGIELKILDPDIDLLKMEHLKEKDQLGGNQIGGVLLEYDHKVVGIPYHQWMTFATIHKNKEPYKYIKAFHGEEQFIKSINRLLRKGERKKALVMIGSGQLDLHKKGRLGGSHFLEILTQLGLELHFKRIGIDPVVWRDTYDLALHLDGRKVSGKSEKEWVEKIYREEIPLLVSKSVDFNESEQEEWTLLAPYAVIGIQKVVYQEKYSWFHPFTLPLKVFPKHRITGGMHDMIVILNQSSIFKEGVSEDPRMKVEPLLWVPKDELIWADSDLIRSQKFSNHSFGDFDQASPLLVGLTTKREKKNGIYPSLVLIGSRAPFENRFIHEAGNRNFVYRCVEWLLNGEQTSYLPPQKLHDYRLHLPPEHLPILQILLLTFIPTLLTILSWKGRLKSS